MITSNPIMLIFYHTNILMKLEKIYQMAVKKIGIFPEDAKVTKI